MSLRPRRKSPEKFHLLLHYCSFKGHCHMSNKSLLFGPGSIFSQHWSPDARFYLLAVVVVAPTWRLRLHLTTQLFFTDLSSEGILELYSFPPPAPRPWLLSLKQAVALFYSLWKKESGTGEVYIQWEIFGGVKKKKKCIDLWKSVYLRSLLPWFLNVARRWNKLSYGRMKWLIQLQ